MENCPKCASRIDQVETNIVVAAEAPHRKVMAKVCDSCDFLELSLC